MTAPIAALLARSEDVSVVLPHARALATLVDCPLLVIALMSAGDFSPPATAIRADATAWLRRHEQQGAQVVNLAAEPMSSVLAFAAQQQVACMVLHGPEHHGPGLRPPPVMSGDFRASAPCPLLFVSSRCDPAASGPIIVPLDDRLSAEAVLPISALLAQRAGVHVVLVHASSVHSAPQSDRPQDWVDRLAAESALREAEQRCVAFRVEAKVVLRPGQPADVIISEALRPRARAIVMSTHARTGLARLVLGSVADAVVAAGAVPTLLARPGLILPPELVPARYASGG